MVTDFDSGEFVPLDQVLKDPDHINKLDILDQDHRGSLKLVLTPDDYQCDGDDEEGAGEDLLAVDASSQNASPRFDIEPHEPLGDKNSTPVTDDDDFENYLLGPTAIRGRDLVSRRKKGPRVRT